ncbi:hypothetical protein XELAEV_180074946mg, partial [Xenopus laevis]
SALYLHQMADNHSFGMAPCVK